ncbi:TRADD-N-associated membrane domain-containing protein [Anabaena azotica]|uniref:TRADD-N-associated membrane domain-containing protein n=1 Tax=Anabaena azotica TaxID=197653 RepID=UPI0039A70CD1
MFNLFNQFPAKDLQITPKQHNDIMNVLMYQEQLSFHIKLGISTASAILIFCGVGLFYADKIPEGRLTVAVGILSSFINFNSANGHKNKLEQLLERSQIIRECK